MFMAAVLFIVEIQVSKVKRKWYSYEKSFRKTGSVTTDLSSSSHLSKGLEFLPPCIIYYKEIIWALWIFKNVNCNYWKIWCQLKSQMNNLTRLDIVTSYFWNIPNVFRGWITLQLRILICGSLVVLHKDLYIKYIFSDAGTSLFDIEFYGL